MYQREDEPFEDYIDRFQFCLKKFKHNRLTPKSLKVVYLRGVNKECIDALNLMGGGDITQSTFDDIFKLARNFFRATPKKDRSSRFLPTTKTSTGVSRVELTNLLSNMKGDIISHLETQLDTLHKKIQEAEAALAEYYPCCRQKRSNCRCKKLIVITKEKSICP